MTWFAEAAKTRYYSQSGEDGVIEEMLRRMGKDDGAFLECGAGDGTTNSNTRKLAENGWRGIWIETDQELMWKAVELTHELDLDVIVEHRLIRRDDLDQVLDLNAEEQLDLLSLDIDGNDYWVWKSLKRQPSIVCIEYNAAFPPTESRTIEYDPDFRWSGTDYHGATAGALHKLGREKGYTLVAYCGVNLFFVRDEFAELFGEIPLADVPQRRGHRKDPTRVMIEV